MKEISIKGTIDGKEPERFFTTRVANGPAQLASEIDAFCRWQTQYRGYSYQHPYQTRNIIDQIDFLQGEGMYYAFILYHQIEETVK